MLKSTGFPRKSYDVQKKIDKLRKKWNIKYIFNLIKFV